MALVAMALSGGLLSGCGGGVDPGPTRFNVTGTVSYDGKLVPAGNIQFLPDTAKSNSGPAGYATIKDGKFSTGETGKGVVGGPHTVIITGLKRAPSNEPEPFVEGGESNSLFPEYRTEVDLPKSDSEEDFSITAPAL